MKELQILIPMGGLGQRFRDAGYTTPKPLIEVSGEPMFMKALGSFDIYQGPKKYLFVIRQDAEKEYRLATSIKNILPEADVSMLDHNTRGAVETCLVAGVRINKDNPLIVMDCDFSFESKQYFGLVNTIATDQAYDGLLLTFSSDDPRYSYAKANSQGLATETAEKRVISNNAIAGAYCFGSGRLFVEAANELMKRSLDENMKEYYISYLYNILIKQGKKIAIAHIEKFNSFGTPGELKDYLATTS